MAYYGKNGKETAGEHEGHGTGMTIGDHKEPVYERPRLVPAMEIGPKGQMKHTYYDLDQGLRDRQARVEEKLREYGLWGGPCSIESYHFDQVDMVCAGHEDEESYNGKRMRKYR